MTSIYKNQKNYTTLHFIKLHQTFHTFSGFKLSLPQIKLRRFTDEYGLAGKIVLAKPAAAKARHTPD
jgi:hypothetical protein